MEPEQSMSSLRRIGSSPADGGTAAHIGEQGEAIGWQVDMQDLVPGRDADVLLEYTHRTEPDRPRLDLGRLRHAVAGPPNDAGRIAANGDRDFGVLGSKGGNFASGMPADVGHDAGPGARGPGQHRMP